MRCKLSFFSAIATTSLTILAIAPPIFANPAPISSWKISQQDKSQTLPQTASLIYVAPQANPNGDGSINNPYTSITTALATRPVAGTVIQLQQGIYNAETGESFPIRLPAGVTLRGEPTVRGLNVVINGGGKFISPSFASQNITILANDDNRLEGITLTNPNTRGTAVWVESGKRVVIVNNTFINSDREGVFLTGTADATINDNIFTKNGANGLSAVGSSTGEIRNNIFESTGFGLAIGQKSRVNLSNNNILSNVDGIIISNLSAPTLRNNLISDNQRNGIAILKDRKGYPTPDLGTSKDLGKNIFRNNRGKDLSNNSGVTQVAVGNEIDRKKIEGKIAFVGEEPTAPAPQIVNIPIAPISRSEAPSLVSNTVTNVEITRSPQPSFNRPVTPPVLLPPSNNSTLVDPLFPPNSKPATLNPSIAQTPDNILIDRDPIPLVPPPPVTLPRSQFIPNNPPTQIIPSSPSSTPTTPPTTLIYTSPIVIPYNAKLAALVPATSRDRFPYLVVIPSADSGVLNRVRSAVPSAKIVSSRFGNIIMVEGYPDRDRAEVLKTIMRSEIGLDARVVHQNSL